ncbi:MAG: nitroreductase family deazaflavin-dependent oxidoreductase [Anaerolineaceae bacterium]
MEKIKNVQKPHGLERLIWRAPIWLYQIGMGSLMGEQYILLNHVGRISGQPRQAVVEVIHHDQETGVYIVASGFGEKSDWYQNVVAHPHMKIQVGRRRISVLAWRLPLAQATKSCLNIAVATPPDYEPLQKCLATILTVVKKINDL